MAIVPRLAPPVNDLPIAGDGQHSQAWTAHFQEVADQLANIRRGVVDGSDATAGQIGEYITATGSIALATNVAGNVASISLTAGDWDVFASVNFVSAPGATRVAVAGACSLASGVLAGLPGGGGLAIYQGASTNESGTYPIMPGRLSLVATTTVYLVALAGFSGGMTASGFIAARRVR